MEVRKIQKKQSKLVDGLPLDGKQQRNCFNFSQTTIHNIKREIRKWHEQDIERIKLLPPLHIEKCENIKDKPKCEISSKNIENYSCGFGYLNLNTKKLIHEDNESVSSSDESDEENDFTNFSSSSNICQSSENITPLGSFDQEISLDKSESCSG